MVVGARPQALKITAEFVSSAASAADLPRGDTPEIAFVGRSNVGKSSLINALVGHRLARTSRRPGKTRLANLYRVEARATGRFWLVDLPGFGYARGGESAAEEFEKLTREYFARGTASEGSHALEAPGASIAALFLVDARHPGLTSDRLAWDWLQSVVKERAVVATKVDKLARGERIRALRELESVFDDSVIPVSAVTDEGLDELWTLITRLANTLNPQRARLPPKR